MKQPFVRATAGAAFSARRGGWARRRLGCEERVDDNVLLAVKANNNQV
jgi:hypothetical protein